AGPAPLHHEQGRDRRQGLGRPGALAGARMKRLFLLALFAFAAAGVHAASPEQKVYDGIMSDSELYAGEGVVSLDSFGGDLEKAKASARERARANLVESIKVHVVSKTTDTQSQGAAGSKEEIHSQSSSSADLELENIQYKALAAFPKE